MSSFGSVAWSSVGKKVITGLTGFLLVGFVVVHLLGNLTLFIGPDAFNGYAHFLESAVHGWLIYAFEAGLIVIFAFHIAAAVTVAVADKMAARKQGYKYARNAGGRSRKTLASRSMIVSGSVIAVFVIAHIFMFKFNAGNAFTKNPDGTKNFPASWVKAVKDSGSIGVGYMSQVLRDTSVKPLRLSYTNADGSHEWPKPVHLSYLIMGKYPFPVPIWVYLRDLPNQYNLPSGFMQYMTRNGDALKTLFAAGIEPAYAKFSLTMPEE